MRDMKSARPRFASPFTAGMDVLLVTLRWKGALHILSRLSGCRRTCSWRIILSQGSGPRDETLCRCSKIVKAPLEHTRSDPVSGGGRRGHRALAGPSQLGVLPSD